jgi:hypothetical protein
MTFKSPLWRPVSVVLSAVNLVAVGFAAGMAEPWHAAVHAGLALGFGLWAQRLLQRVPGSGSEQLEAGLEQLESLEAEVGRLGRDLGEMQERLDFTERVLAQQAEARRLGPER